MGIWLESEEANKKENVWIMELNDLNFTSVHSHYMFPHKRHPDIAYKSVTSTVFK